MYTILLDLHSILRWVIIVLALMAIVGNANSRKPFTTSNGKVGLFLMISAHTTLVIGLYLYFFGPWGLATIRNLGFGEVMKDPVSRFYAIEHIFGMLVAIVLITVARRAAKKNIPDASKHRRVFWLVLIALVIILATVPWPFRAGIARPWLV